VFLVEVGSAGSEVDHLDMFGCHCTTRTSGGAATHLVICDWDSVES
jgi:hypothetical protein